MLLREYIQTILLTLMEGKLDILQQKYPNVDIQTLSNNDPSETNKYLEWMAKQVNAGANPEDVIPTINYFHNNQNKFKIKDLNQYKTLKDLEDTVKEIEEKLASGDLSKSRREMKKDAVKIYEDDQVVTYRMDSKNACVLYGSNTKWCITMRNASFYEQYKGSNVIFYFVLRKQPEGNELDKIAIAYQRGFDNEIVKIDYFNSLDEEISSNELIKFFPNFNKLINITESDATKQPKGFLAKLRDQSYSKEELIDYIQSLDLENAESEREVQNQLDHIFRYIGKLDDYETIINLLFNHKNPNVKKYSLVLQIKDYATRGIDPFELVKKYSTFVNNEDYEMDQRISEDSFDEYEKIRGRLSSINKILKECNNPRCFNIFLQDHFKTVIKKVAFRNYMQHLDQVVDYWSHPSSAPTVTPEMNIKEKEIANQIPLNALFEIMESTTHIVHLEFLYEKYTRADIFHNVIVNLSTEKQKIIFSRYYDSIYSLAERIKPNFDDLISVCKTKDKDGYDYYIERLSGFPLVESLTMKGHWLNIIINKTDFDIGSFHNHASELINIIGDISENDIKPEGIQKYKKLIVPIWNDLKKIRQYLQIYKDFRLKALKQKDTGY